MPNKFWTKIFKKKKKKTYAGQIQMYSFQPPQKKKNVKPYDFIEQIC